LKTHRIEEETTILPDLIAEMVVQEVERFAGGEPLSNRAELISKLEDRAQRHYNADEKFREKVRNRQTWGRDWHYCFMRHWLAGEVPHLRLPASFANGEALR
jgi:hypothetical protein